MQEENWYRINNVDEVDSPALLVYPERVKHNIAMAISMVGHPGRLRPHIKTHKTKEVVRLLQEAGVHQFKCATIAEAELLASCNAADVLLAYQPIGPKLQRFIRLMKAYPAVSFSCLADHVVAAAEIAAVAEKHQLTIAVYIDLNVGMNRTGINPGAEAFELAGFCKKQRGLLVKGLHAYDGHLRNPSLAERTSECNAAFEPVLQLQKQISGHWYQNINIIAGGSPSFPIHAKRENVQCSPGTFVYWDHGYHQLFPEQDFLPAALVLARVISLPAPDRLCIDLGHKSVAAENPIDRRVVFLNAPELKALSQSEEHLVVSAPENHRYQPGDVLYGLPMHICPTCALYERAITIENGNATGEWRITGRDRKITY